MKFKQYLVALAMPVVQFTVIPILAFTFLALAVNAKGVNARAISAINTPIGVTELSGYVYDETGQTLPGATVIEKGTNNATSTDEKGFFKLKVKAVNAILIVRSIGYQPQEVTGDKNGHVRVTMKMISNDLKETVIVGYGTQQKINLTGAVSSIGTQELVQSPVANISNSLVGRLPGVFASQSNGEPGNDGSTIRIRGVATYTGNTDPLILVDGIEVVSFNNIDPNEIASLTVLKDASSTAVYGIRGANGVIIITTRRGTEGTPTISYSFNQAINSFTALRNTMNSADYARSSNAGQLADSYVSGAAYTPRYSAADIALYENGQDPIFHPNTNWYDLIFKKASLQSQNNLTIRGGQKAVKYFISAGLFSQDGLFKDTKEIVSEFSANTIYKRYNFRSNFNFNVNSRFKIALDLSSQTENRSGNNQNIADNTQATRRVIGDVGRASPLDGPGVVDGKIVNISTVYNNPFKSLLAAAGSGGLRREYDNTLNGSLRLDHELDFITKGLKVHANIALISFNNQVITNQKSVTLYLAVKLPDGSINYVPQIATATPEFKFVQSGTDYRRVTGEFAFDYSRTFGKNHAITGLLLYNQQKTYDPSLAFLIPKGYQSIVSRLTYAYKGRYFAEFDAGYNGTENFAPGKRFGFFPAYSAGWIPSEEKFFPKNKIISFLKFRGSYGEVGNDKIGGARFLYNPTSYTYKQNMYYFGNYGTNYTSYQGPVEGRAGNPNVTWERAQKTDIGMDLYMFKEHLKVTFDYFRENRNNILTDPQTISLISGIIQPAVNLGRMSNRGFDGDITYLNNIGGFAYRVSGNYSFARNKILANDEIPNRYPYQNRTGQRFGQYYGAIVDGLYNTWAEVNDVNRPLSQGNNKVQPGDFKIRDINGDGIIDDYDQVPIGYSNIPEITYGLTLGGSYKNFDFSVLFQGTGNVSIAYTRFQRNTNFGGSPPEGAADYLIQSWTPERYAQGLPINFPRFTYAGSNPNKVVNTDFFTADAKYLRLKNIEVGYTLKAGLLKKIGVTSARFYGNANNLYTWTGVYHGIDPENLPATDVNQENYPLVRTVNLGVRANF